MVVDLMVKRLLLQAGVAVLTGVLMSSAVMAEDASASVEDASTDVSVVDGADMGEGVDTSPVEIESPTPEGGNEGTGEGVGTGVPEPEITECGFELEPLIGPTVLGVDGEDAGVVDQMNAISGIPVRGLAKRAADRDGNEDLPWYLLRRKTN